MGGGKSEGCGEVRPQNPEVRLEGAGRAVWGTSLSWNLGGLAYWLGSLKTGALIAPPSVDTDEIRR